MRYRFTYLFKALGVFVGLIGVFLAIRSILTPSRVHENDFMSGYVTAQKLRCTIDDENVVTVDAFVLNEVGSAITVGSDDWELEIGRANLTDAIEMEPLFLTLKQREEGTVRLRFKASSQQLVIPDGEATCRLRNRWDDNSDMLQEIEWGSYGRIADRRSQRSATGR